jgi:hypothetical protein
MLLPPVHPVRQPDTHRLVPSKHLAHGDSVLTRIADDDAHLRAIFELDDATNDRLVGERGRLSGIGPDELLAGVPHASIVNAAFCHAHPLGSRFNGPDRSAWYAGFELETSQAEVAFHKAIELAEIGWRDGSVTYDDYLADLSAEFHDLRGARGLKACLAPDSYVASQALAEELLRAGSLGIVYPSVRNAGGTSVACFRPALVTNVRKGGTWRFTWTGEEGPHIESARSRSRV